jgi:hypothetical protein
MREKAYYSVRSGKNKLGGKFDLRLLSEMVGALYASFTDEGYFGEAFGYSDASGRVRGKLGSNIQSTVRKLLRKKISWPPTAYYPVYSEDDVFDIIELLFDSVSLPVLTGKVITSFDKAAGQTELRSKVNALLQDYEGGYELSNEGEVLAVPEEGLGDLLKATLPESDPTNVNTRVDGAIKKFRSRHSSPGDRRDAIRDLADVLEFLRPQLRDVLNRKDEADLFTLANSFGIRHHNDLQKTEYNKAIWYSWMFYYYLATIHASVRLLDRHMQSNSVNTTVLE